MRVLVTGADGFVGSHLVDALLNWDAVEQVVALVHKAPIRWLPREPNPRLHIVMQDIIRLGNLSKIGEVDVIYHLAAVSSGSACERNPETARLTNFQGTVNLLNLSLAMGRRPTFVFLSSAALYGEPEYLPIDEVHPVEPRDQYTSSKLSAEITVNAYTMQQDLPTVVIRPFNIFGPRHGGDFVIPSIIHQCLQGTDPRLGDGRLVRNFTYVTDAVDCILRAGVTPAANGRIVNLGSRESFSISEVAEKIIDLMWLDLTPNFGQFSFRDGDPTVLQMDPSLAERLLGWRQKVSFEQGLEHTIDFFRKEFEHRRALASQAMYG